MDLNKAKLFILGGNGFIGSAFSRYASGHGIEHAVIQKSNYSDFTGKTCDKCGRQFKEIPCEGKSRA